MKQFQFEYKNINNFRRELARVKRFCDTATHSSVFFQFFTQLSDFEKLREITHLIEDEFPTAYYYGCQSYGNIIDGKLAKDNTLIVCSVFEYESTKTELIYIDPTDPNAKFQTLDDLWEYCNKIDLLKGIELTCTYTASAMLTANDAPLPLQKDIQVFGSVAICPNDIVSDESYLFTKDNGFSSNAIVAILLGGEDLNISCTYYNGWKGFGKHFTITKCDGKIIHEIDNEPAMDIYKNYLNIEYDEDFLQNTMQFPLLVNEHGVECIRMPMPTKDPNDIKLTVNVHTGMHLRLSYGEPSSIISTIHNYVQQIYDFAPETIRIYSCAIRRNFWGDDRVSRETSMLDGIASTIGFYTRGEILRVGDYLQYFNATIVSCLVREGQAVEPDFELDEIIETNTTELAFSTKLIHYLGAITNEIESQYNRTLSSIASTYKTLLSIDLKENVITQLDHNPVTQEHLQHADTANDQMVYCTTQNVTPAFLQSCLKFCDLSTLPERMQGVSHIESEFIGNTVGWFRAQFVAISYDDKGMLEQVLYSTQIIDDDKKKEEKLLLLANTDEQTGLFNRRSYELDLAALESSSIEERFVYVAIDINGLKTANDTLGHAAGDELIEGTAKCMKQAFGSYGKVYRIGGDEFVAIIFISERQLSHVRKDFEKLVEDWTGNLVDKLSVAAGYVLKKNVPSHSIDEIEKLADDLMYQSKDQYYKRNGISRRQA